VVVDRVAVARGAGAVRHDPVEVEIGEDQLLAGREPGGLGEQVAVLVDQRLPVPGQIGRGLAHAGGGVDVTGDRPGRLGGAQLPAKARLAHRDVAGRQIREHGGACERAVRAGRHRHPQVFADLDVNGESGQIAGGEHEVRPERHV
jgi:hypothetical protein